jgi:hypothetical protein
MVTVKTAHASINKRENGNGVFILDLEVFLSRVLKVIE